MSVATDFIIHIGDGKCGSTSLQRSLYDHREALATNGLIYDTISPQSAHFSAITLIGGQTRGNDLEQKARAKKTLKKIQEHDLVGKTVLLSAENFFTHDPAEVLTLCNRISARVGKVTAIGYVREPSSMYLSLVQQTLKANHIFPSPERYSRPLQKYVGAWREALGHEHVYISSFDKRCLYGRDISLDFSRKVSQITEKNILLTSREQNSGLLAEQMIAMQSVRRTFFSDSAGTRAVKSDKLEKLFMRLNDIKKVGTDTKLREDIAQVIKNQQGREFLEVIPAYEREIYESSGYSLYSEPATDKLASSEEVGSILSTYDAKLASLLCQIFVHDVNKPQELTPSMQAYAARFQNSATAVIDSIFEFRQKDKQ